MMWHPGEHQHYSHETKKCGQERSRTAFMCLPLRAGVLTIGLLGSTLALSGLVAYAIVQVPTLRAHIGRYNIEEDGKKDPGLSDIAYGSEMIGAVVGSLLGLLVNLMLVFAVLRSRRWFIVHWLVLHVILIIILFITSILLFVIQEKLFKLLGLIPTAVALLVMYCWTKVWELFGVLGEQDKQENLDQLTASLRYQLEVAQQPNYTKAWLEGLDKEWPQEFQFYPGDPLSRGMARRLEGVWRGVEGAWRGSWPSMGGLPYDEMEDCKDRTMSWRGEGGERGRVVYELNHEYEGESSSTVSSIVPNGDSMKSKSRINSYNKQGGDNRGNSYSKNNTGDSRNNSYNKQGGDIRSNSYSKNNTGDSRNNSFNKNNSGDIRSNSYNRNNNGDSRDNSYNKQGGDSRDNSYNKQGGDSRDNSYNKQGGDSRDNSYNKQGGDSRDNSYNKQGGDSRDNSYNKNKSYSADGIYRKEDTYNHSNSYNKHKENDNRLHKTNSYRKDNSFEDHRDNGITTLRAQDKIGRKTSLESKTDSNVSDVVI